MAIPVLRRIIPLRYVLRRAQDVRKLRRDA
jgi:hypothetical protein